MWRDGEGKGIQVPGEQVSGEACPVGHGEGAMSPRQRRPPLVSRTRCSASSAVHRRAGTHHAGPQTPGSRVCSASFRKRSMLRSARDTIPSWLPSWLRVLAARFRPS